MPGWWEPGSYSHAIGTGLWDGVVNFADPMGWGPEGGWFLGFKTAGDLHDFIETFWSHNLPENWFGHTTFGIISAFTSPLSIGQQTAYASVNYDIQPWYVTAFQVGGDIGESIGLVFGAFKVSKMGGFFKGSTPSVCGGAGPVHVGQAGENAVRGAFNIGDKVKIRINGRNRIPDGLTGNVLSEVKNVDSLSYTQQLRDFADFAQQTGKRFDLYVRPNTKLSGPLQQAFNSGVINIIRVNMP